MVGFNQQCDRCSGEWHYGAAGISGNVDDRKQAALRAKATVRTVFAARAWLDRRTRVDSEKCKWPSTVPQPLELRQLSEGRDTERAKSCREPLLRGIDGF